MSSSDDPADREQPVVTVIIAAYEPGPLLRDALASVRRQSWTDWRLIVVDDGSREDLSWVGGVDGRISLLRRPNGGVSVARNTGVAASSSPYLAFLDQDDVWHPDKLARQLDAIGQAPFAYTAFDLIDRHGERIGPGYGRAVSYRDMADGQFGMLLSSLLVRREALGAVGGFDPRLRIQQDLEVFLRLARRGEGVFVDTVEVDYRLHAGNGSRDHRQAWAELCTVFDREAAQAPDAAATLRSGRARAARTYAFQAVDAARDAPGPAAARELAWALRRSPSAVAASVTAWMRERVSAPRSNSLT